MGGKAIRKKFPNKRTLKQQIKKLIKDKNYDELNKLSFKGGTKGEYAA